ncbi:Uncharacterized conserved protein YbjT, contains NAD(P)-binding and DUF2867 domains [Marinococcus luteus]|uniref:Uncharacterized conserved protein YbjT, contains NAD(P)-binding and DUF2867 domains n=1 Tax=Marinococcus luteus TaxID=1122204 RepID=A0A1H2UII2_9BACI|nr:NAD(P)H-binding protein [Marinococcus luteus]SDW55986.1 Uncharacterized conserved protein YbjT, contains NAD(P)-binding and DUF2867 domains [Marinococcus luteus]
MKYVITGATGHLGGKVTEELLGLVPKEQVTLGVRRPEKATVFREQNINIEKMDYYSFEEQAAAFYGADVVLYIPSITHPAEQRIKEFQTSVEAAEQAGVKKFMFIGFTADHWNNPFHMSPFFGYAVRRIAMSRMAGTIIRNGVYADPLVAYTEELVRTKRLPYPAGRGAISFISRRDLARAIAAAAAAPGRREGIYTLTGIQAYTMDELCELLSNITGERIRYEPMEVQEFARTYDDGSGFGSVNASLYEAASLGLMGEVTSDVERLTGKPPEMLRSYLERHLS